eukprot:357809-Chlamydomonas_euryale.AAC.6
MLTIKLSMLVPLLHFNLLHQVMTIGQSASLVLVSYRHVPILFRKSAVDGCLWPRRLRPGRFSGWVLLL